MIVDGTLMTQIVAAAVGAAVVATIGIFQHYTWRNLVSVVAGFALFAAALAWTDPNPDLHAFKVGLSALGAGMWVSAVREEKQRRKLKTRERHLLEDGAGSAR